MHLDSLHEWLGTDLATQYSHNVNIGKEKIWGGEGGVKNWYRYMFSSEGKERISRYFLTYKGGS